MDKRLIEETFPIKEVSFYSAKEKNIRHGHISTLHIWWARRPLAASRATAYAALIPAPDTEKEIEEEKKFISDFSKWENTNNPKFIERARKKILKAYNGKPPKVLDPFGGGGSIPLECLRLGCETYSNDLNPVAVLIQKCTLEYPNVYGQPGEEKQLVTTFGKSKKENIKVQNVLLEDIKYWSKWVLNEVQKKISEYYPSEKDGSVPISYIWARTIPCQNPSCGIDIPLLRQFWLVKKSSVKVSLFPMLNGKEVEFKIVGNGFEKMPKDFDPTKGTIQRAITTCLRCGSQIDASTLKKLFHQKKNSQRLLAVVTQKPDSSDRYYRTADKNDKLIFSKVHSKLQKEIEIFKERYGYSPIPDEALPPRGTLGFRIQAYNMNTWGELFNARQLLTLITFIRIIKELIQNLTTSKNFDYAKSVASYLSLGVGRLADYYNTLTRWDNTQERTVQLFSRNAIPMIWDYSELNPLSSTVGSWESMMYRRIWKVIETLESQNNPARVFQMSATQLNLPDNEFDAVFTDPPYYDNIPYSYLSDFFYVWLKRIVGEIFPEFFSTPLTPKKSEIVAYSNIPGGFDAGKKFFEEMLKKSFKEIYRVLKPNGIAIVVYAHKSTAGWETLINSLLDSGLIVTSAWPISTEQEARLRANESAALASSIYIVCRKINRQPSALYSEVKTELNKFLENKLDKLWSEGIGGADFFISAIGASIEIFGKYNNVTDYSGKNLRADTLLQDVRTIVTDYAVRKILHNGFASEISDLTRFYILFRWEFGVQKVEFDEANKLAHSCHIDLAEEWTKKSSFIKKDKEFISILGPQDRDIEDIEESSELIDVLHLSLKYWEKNRKAELNTLLRVSGFGKSDAFFRVAQAIAETLPQDNKEKKLLEGFLNLREKIISSVSEPKTKYDQGKLEFPENE